MGKTYGNGARNKNKNNKYKKISFSILVHVTNDSLVMHFSFAFANDVGLSFALSSTSFSFFPLWLIFICQLQFGILFVISFLRIFFFLSFYC